MANPSPQYGIVWFDSERLGGNKLDKWKMAFLLKLFWIWCIPHRGTRLPLRHEMMRFWYGWKLIVVTCPLNRKKK